MSDLTSWKRKSEKLADELEEYARNYICKKCTRFYCSHMLKARGAKFKERIDYAMFDLVNLCICDTKKSLG